MIWLWIGLAVAAAATAGVTLTLRHPRRVAPLPAQPQPRLVQDPPYGSTVLANPPMVDGQTLRDWLIHHHPRHNDAWPTVVMEFYKRAGDDPDIARYFVGVDMEALCNHFLKALLVLTHTGLTERAATTLGGKHQYLGIRPDDFDKVTAVLVQVLQDNGVPGSAIQQLVPAVVILRDRIVRGLP